MAIKAAVRPKQGARDYARLSTEQKIKVVEGARRLLGPNGENWIRGQWFGKRWSDKGTTSTAFSATSPEFADCWCLLGALEESAYRLGYSTSRERKQRFGQLTSLKALIRRKLGRDVGVDCFNDSSGWPSVRGLLDDRLKELRASLKVRP